MSAKEKRRAASRAYYAKNREKILERQRIYRQRNKDTINRKRREYYKRNRARILENQRKRRLKNPEKRKEARRKYRAANIEKIREYKRQYYRKNRERILKKARERRAAKKKQEEIKTQNNKLLTEKELRTLYPSSAGDMTLTELREKHARLGGVREQNEKLRKDQKKIKKKLPTKKRQVFRMNKTQNNKLLTEKELRTLYPLSAGDMTLTELREKHARLEGLREQQKKLKDTL